MNDLPDDIAHIANALYPHTRDLGSVYTHTDPSGAVYGWRVDEALRLTKGRAPALRIDTAEHVERVRKGGGRIDHGYAMGLAEDRLAVPAIVATAEVPGGGREAFVIDGNHRVYRAWVLGRRKFPAVLLTDGESDACRLPEAVALAIAAGGRP